MVLEAYGSFLALWLCGLPDTLRVHVQYSLLKYFGANA